MYESSRWYFGSVPAVPFWARLLSPYARGAFYLLTIVSRQFHSSCSSFCYVRLSRALSRARSDQHDVGMKSPCLLHSISHPQNNRVRSLKPFAWIAIISCCGRSLRLICSSHRRSHGYIHTRNLHPRASTAHGRSCRSNQHTGLHWSRCGVHAQRQSRAMLRDTMMTRSCTG